MTIHQRQQNKAKPVYYYPDSRLPDYIDRMLQLINGKAALEMRGAEMEQKKESDHDYKQATLAFAEESRSLDLEINALRQAKKRLLDEVIFPSMANIVVFLDLAAQHDVIGDDFDNAISDLLGVSVDKKLPFRKYGDELARPMAFAEIVEAALKQKHPSEEKIDFRVALPNILLALIWSKLESAMSQTFKPEFMTLMAQDFQRVRMWTRLCAGESGEKFDAPADRAIYIPTRER